MPIRLYVIGHVKVDAPGRVADEFSVDHFDGWVGRGGSFEEEQMPDPFIDALPPGKERYTTVTGQPIAAHLDADLSFVPSRSLTLAYARAIEVLDAEETEFLLGASAVVVLSCLAGGIVGRLLYGRWRPFMLLGMGNLFTVVGLVVVVILLGPALEGTRQERRKGALRKFTFCVAVAVVYPALVLIAKFLLLLPMVGHL